MQIVIEIDEEMYKQAVDKVRADYPYYESYELHKAIRNGTPLPKGHGRLIDADKLMEYCQNQKQKTISCNDIARFPTVIRADKEEK